MSKPNAQNITFPPLEPYQKDLFELYLTHEHSYTFVVKAIRQVGKSICLQLLLLHASLSRKNSVSLCVSPVISQCRKMFEDIQKMAKPFTKKSNACTLEILFDNGSKILFRSGEQGDSIRGITVKNGGILVIDEAAYIQSDVYYSILLPTTNVFRSNIFICSTPRFKTGFFYELWKQGNYRDRAKHIIACDWTKYDTSKFLPPETLEMYRKQLPKTAFTSEFLGEFIDGDGAVFCDFKKSISDNLRLDAGPLYLSVDWGTGAGGNADDTCISVGQVQKNKVVVYKQEYFNNVKPVEQAKKIVRMIHEYVDLGRYRDITLIVEKNSIGAVYYDILKEEIDKFETQWNEKHNALGNELFISLQTHTTTNESKKRMVERLSKLFEQRQILIPNSEKLINQLSMFEAHVNQHGTVLYAGAKGGHDDCVMSICFLVDKLYKEINDD